MFVGRIETAETGRVSGIEALHYAGEVLDYLPELSHDHLIGDRLHAFVVPHIVVDRPACPELRMHAQPGLLHARGAALGA